MKVMIIGSQDAVWGFALAGIRGQIVNSPEELRQAFETSLADRDIGIILVTEEIANMARSYVDQLIVRSTTPLIVEIPGPEGPDPNRPPLSEIIRQTIGVRI